jgi:hypothetical protein
MNEQLLTRLEATSLVVGGGIMAVPFLADRVGLVGLAVILPIAWVASSLIHLMLAEVLFRTGRDLKLENANLCNADLSGTYRDGVKLTGANLTQATPENADLTQVNLARARFEDARLSGITLTNTAPNGVAGLTWIERK